jgi:hypothetical protein
MRRSSTILFLGLLVACGGAVTSVDGNDPTASLSPTDQDQLCNDTYNYARQNLSPTDVAKISCGFQTEVDAGATCSQAFNTCVAQETNGIGALPPGPPTAAECATFNQQVAACNTTVGEYTKCLVQELNAVKSLEGQMPLCTEAAMQIAELNALSQFSEDCVALLDSCQITFVPTGGSVSVTQFDGGKD